MTNLEFFQSLDYTDGLSVVEAISRRFPLQYGTTLGLNGHPQIRPIEFKLSENRKLYLATVIKYTSYKEMQNHPYLQICVYDQETMTYLRVVGKINFTDDPDIIEKCFANSPVLTSQFGNSRELVIAYYLTDAWAEFASFSPSLKYHKYEFEN